MNQKEMLELYNKLEPQDKELVMNFILLMNRKNNAEWISVREAANKIGYSTTTIRRLIEDGSIRSKNIGERKTLVLSEDINAIWNGKNNLD